MSRYQAPRVSTLKRVNLSRFVPEVLNTIPELGWSNAVLKLDFSVLVYVMDEITTAEKTMAKDRSGTPWWMQI